MSVVTERESLNLTRPIRGVNYRLERSVKSENQNRSVDSVVAIARYDEDSIATMGRLSCRIMGDKE